MIGRWLLGAAALLPLAQTAPVVGPVVVWTSPPVAIEHARGAALWLSSAAPEQRVALENALVHLAPRLERAHNPLAEDLDDEPLAAESKRVQTAFAPGFAVLDALSGPSCDAVTCVQVASTCPEAASCTELAPALGDERTRFLLWPLAHGAVVRCLDPAAIAPAVARLQAASTRRDSRIGWALGSFGAADDAVPRAARIVLDAAGTHTVPGWVHGLAQARSEAAQSWMPRPFVAPRLSRLTDPAFVAEVEASIRELGCHAERWGTMP